MINTGRTLHLKRIRASAILFLVSLLAAGCATAQANPAETSQALPPSIPSSSPTARPEPSSSPTHAATLTPTPVLEEGSFVVTLETGESFNGRMRGHGEIAIILANMSRGTESQWARLYENLDEDKYTVITYSWLRQTYAIDQTKALLEHLRSAGFERVICLGASVGVGACGSLADQPEIIGLVFIAGPAKHDLADTDFPKLFIAGEDDDFALNAKLDYEDASEPKELVLYPTYKHGTDLFDSDYGDEFLDLLLTFIDEAAASG